jgi:hypothetical protein
MNSKHCHYDIWARSDMDTFRQAARDLFPAYKKLHHGRNRLTSASVHGTKERGGAGHERSLVPKPRCQGPSALSCRADSGPFNGCIELYAVDRERCANCIIDKDESEMGTASF